MSRKRQAVSVSLRDPVHCLAFGFGAGLSPVAPGTVGTAVAIPLYLLLAQCPLTVYLLCVLVALVGGIWICGESARRIGVHDHSGIVWDEIACYLLALLPFEPSLTAVLAGFLGFRFFDVVKPWPIRWLDRHVHGGTGIMLDDVVAAVMTGLSLWLAAAWLPAWMVQGLVLRSF